MGPEALTTQVAGATPAEKRRGWPVPVSEKPGGATPPAPQMGVVSHPQRDSPSDGPC